MRIERNYEPTDVNWVILPDLMERITSEIPDNEKREGERGDELDPAPKFCIKTFSQDIVIDGPQEFIDFVRNTTEQPVTVEVLIKCLRRPASMRAYAVNPPYFRFLWRGGGVKVELDRTTTNIALSTIEEIESKLQLSPAKPPEEPEKERAEASANCIRRTLI